MSKGSRSILARVTPFKRIPKDEDLDPSLRVITVKQLTVLLYNLYITIDDPAIGFEDADQTAVAFQGELNQTVKISQENLEKLLWHTTMAYESNSYWNPAQEPYDQFVNSLLDKNETFDRLVCLLKRKRSN